MFSVKGKLYKLELPVPELVEEFRRVSEKLKYLPDAMMLIER